MEKSRTINATLNAGTAILMQVSVYAVNFITRTIFIYTLGARYLGLNGLFNNVLSLLALSELGISSAITFYLYRPLAENNQEIILSVVQFFKHAYVLIGAFIFTLGCFLIPFLPYIVSFEQNVPENLYIIYLLFLVDVVNTYLFFNYKQVLLTAAQRNYILTSINILFSFINAIVCSVILIVCHNYIAYLLTKLAMQFIQRAAVNSRINKEFPYIRQLKKAKPLERFIRTALIKNIQSIFVFRLASKLYESTDNIIISAAIGTIYVGYYSNYLLIVQMVTAFYDAVMSSFSAGVGNLVTEGNEKKNRAVFCQLEIINTWLITFCSVCMMQLFTPFMQLWLAKRDSGFVLGTEIVFVIVLNFFITNRLKIVFLYKDAFGLFRYGKYRQMAGGIANVILSIFLARSLGLFGILLATNVCNICFSVPAFAKSVFHQGFRTSTWDYYIKFILDAVQTGIIYIIVHWICQCFGKQNICAFIMQILVCIIVVNLVLLLRYYNNPHFKILLTRGKRIFRSENRN